MDAYLHILLVTALTGAGGLALGGGLAALVHGPSDRAVGLLLRFTAGTMLGVVCFDLIPDAAEGGAVLPAAGWAAAGWLAACLLDRWLGGHHGHGGGGLRGAGLAVAAAVAVHNLPVGLAVGAAFAGSARAGLLAALVIGLHNLPEGMSIAAPLLAGGTRPGRAVAAAALSGLPAVLGALLGYGAGTLDPGLLAASLALAAGAMLYVIFGELLPEAERLWRGRLAGLAAALGLLLAMALVLSHTH